MKRKQSTGYLLSFCILTLSIGLSMTGCISFGTNPVGQGKPTNTLVPILSITPRSTITPTFRPTITITLPATSTYIPTIIPTPRIASFFLTYTDLLPITGKNLSNIRLIAEWQQDPIMYGLAFNADGSILAVGPAQPDDSHSINLWSTKDGSLLSILPTTGDYTYNLGFSPDGKKLAAIFASEEVLLWDVQSGDVLPTTPADSHIISLAFSPDSKLLAYGTAINARLYLWDLSQNRLIRIIDAEKHDIRTIIFSPDGHEIITGGSGTGIEVWNSSNGQLLKQVRVFSGCEVYDSAISDKGYIAFLGTFCKNGVSAVEVQEISNFQIVLDKSDLMPLSLAFLPSTDVLMISNCLESRYSGPVLKCTKDEVIFVDVRTGEVLSKIRDAGKIVKVSPDGKRIASATLDGKIQIWGIPSN